MEMTMKPMADRKKKLFAACALSGAVVASGIRAGEWDGWTRVHGGRNDRKLHEIAVVFAGTPSEYLDKRRAYEATVENVVAAITGTEPFGSYRNYFAVYRKDAAGGERPDFADTYVTISPDMSTWPEYDAAFRVVRTGLWTSPETFVHEFGHAIGGLADTYVGEGLAGYAEGRLPNIQAGGATHIDQVKWKEWILPGTPVPTPSGYPGIGYFPIGETGFCCPTETSIMRTGPAFDPVDRQAIVSRLLPISCALPKRALDAGRLVVLKEGAVSVPVRLDYLGLPVGDPSARASFTFTGENGESVTRGVPSVDIPTDRFLRPGVTRIEILAAFTSDHVRRPAVLERRDYVNISWRNAPPAIGSVGAVETVEGQRLEILLAVSDPNGDAVVCRGIGLPAGAAVLRQAGGWVLRWSPTVLQGGRTYSFSVEATDGHLAAAVPVTVTVAESGVPVGFDPLLDGTVRGETGAVVGGDVETSRVARLELDPFPDVPVTIQAGGRFTAGIPGERIREWGDGDRTLSVDAYDSEGAYLGTSRIRLRIDTTAPVVAIAQPFDGQPVGEAVILAADVADLTPVGASFSIAKSDGKEVFSRSLLEATSRYAVTLPLGDRPLPVGEVLTLTVTAHDGMSHGGASSRRFYVGPDRLMHVVEE